MNQFYMAGFAGIIDIRLENRSDNLFDTVKVELFSDLFARSEVWSCRLSSYGSVRKKFKVKPGNAGIELIQFRIFSKRGDSISAYWTETELLVFEKAKELQNISIQAGKLIEVGGVTENAKNMGNSVKVNIDNLIKQEKIHDANDLMTEYRKLPPEFMPLKLEFDHDRSEQLTNSSKIKSAAKSFVAGEEKICLPSSAIPFDFDKSEELRSCTYHREIDFAADPCGLYVGETQCGITKVEDGAYIMAARPQDYLGYEMSALPRVTEFVAEARIQKQHGPHDQWFGFEFGERWPGNYYQFLLNSQGAVRISKHWNKEWRDLGYQDNNHHIRRGNTDNILTAARKGPMINVFVNGHEVLAAEDNDINVGGLGLVVGWGIQAAFSGLKVKGIELGAVFEKAINHWGKLEVLEARPLLEYIKKYEPLYKHPGWASNVTQLLWEKRPDYRKSICVVVSYQALPQIYDGMAAAKLREEINRRGRPDDFEFAYIVTDTGLIQDKIFMQCPLIAVGGPEVNKITAEFMNELPQDSLSTESIKIQHGIDKCIKKVALWGEVAEETTSAVDIFISSGLLDRFLNMIWMRESQESRI
jgi:hypothetical protein